MQFSKVAVRAKADVDILVREVVQEVARGTVPEIVAAAVMVDVMDTVKATVIDDEATSKKRGIRFSPTLCLTHNCNLNCVYCYQKHDQNSRMSLETATRCIDWIFENVPDDMSGVEIGFIGGEPLLEFDLIKQIIAYTISKKIREHYIFYATTNGTVLTDEMKQWLTKHRKLFVLGLSLDGLPETQNHNRSNSYDKIDFDFFVKTWPEQGIKMTLSEYSLNHLAGNIKHAHNLGFHKIGGVNLFEGNFDWNKEEYVRTLILQLQELSDYYVLHDELPLDQMMNRRIEMCEAEKGPPRKWCGIGTGALFFDVDGTRRPCPFVTPMTFEKNELDSICASDFSNAEDFIDEQCYNECYIYPICPHCAGANYLTQKSFKTRDKSKCRLQKLITLFAADLQGKRLVKNPDRYSDNVKYNLITAIQKIKSLYLTEFSEYIQ